ncbi:TnsA endonuclease N-terminal domain-containing protein [Clostridium tagluense]|uniref:Transposase n=1 Tax=Clostridium tagluense TaxID=360422 RepID=A0A401UTZ1_9CLOT|nr:TnsA endonuclease N-terminal domain-containing protein [Clostridium tagluense]GCD13013.1 transposase [Clostridium tagluense]
MAKRERKLNIEKLIKEGRGLGIGSEYKPWLKIQDVASLGRSTRLKGIKTGRQHEFLSDMERNYFYILGFSDCVKDSREQFPALPLEETKTIANELGIEHLKNPKNGEYIVMTTDFLITEETGGQILNLARTIKAKNDLLNRGISEKFEIKRVYWQRRNVNWAIITEEEVDKAIVKNISFFLSYYDIDNLDAFVEMTNIEVQDLILEYIKRIIAPEQTIREISSLFDKDMALDKGTGIALFKHLLAKKIISIELSEIINIDSRNNVDLREKVLNKELNIS